VVDQKFASIRNISHGTPKFFIETDASLEGLAGICQNREIGGRWSEEESSHHINYLELLAIFHALRAFSKDLSATHIQIRTDNTCAMSYINNMGGIKSIISDQLACEIWFWAIKKDIWLSATHVPGKQNLADHGSRFFNDNVEWMLNKMIAKTIMSLWETPSLDMFASRLNKQLDKFVSWKLDPDAEFVNAFDMNWSDIYFYDFPPFSLIPRVLMKLREDAGECILVAPLWTTQSWFPIVMEMLISSPYILPKERNLLTLPGTVKVHPLYKNSY
jgi:hypothetical protein